MNIVILIQLLLAHILVDFVFQTDSWVEKKNNGGIKSFAFWSHVLLTGLLTYLFLQQWNNWWVPLIIIVSHAGADYWKVEQEKKLKRDNNLVENDSSLNDQQKKERLKSGTLNFFIDQTIHIAVLIVLWLVMENGFNKLQPFLQHILTDKKMVSMLTSFIVVTWPVGIVIGKITEPFRKEFNTDDSLSRAGQYIGSFERILVLVFILIGQYAAIGF
ncbi:DUF3307 domain-containing protein [Saccharicrinis aurantiacus]|uniref:DUF3307 domain-containing protein n=1 Tax=Saccharicrinis aurantiacus TaxID=1849719 RepID=UPI0009FB38C6|nr:DUF3307 domain-containing protein [Saccharicrinis aurantiacus]